MTKRVPLAWQILLFSVLILAVTMVGLLFNPIGKAEAHSEGWRTLPPSCIEYAQIDPNPPHCIKWRQNYQGYYVPPHDH